MTRRLTLILALRPIALSLLLSSATVVAQTAGIANNPYTATKKATFIQKLADGTTISRVSTTIEARDSQGRTVQQTTMTGNPGRNIVNTIVMDPAARTTTAWFSRGKQATRTHMPELRPSPRPPGPVNLGNNSGVESSAMGSIASGGIIASGEGPGMIFASTGNLPAVGANTTDSNMRPTTKSENLGGKQVTGVYAEGTRLTVTHPVGYFGNDRPIVRVSETWRSPELKIVVFSTDDDPRTGSRTTELTEIVRAEPDTSLFQVPEGYTIVDQYPGKN
jgi:hypothetical protein